MTLEWDNGTDDFIDEVTDGTTLTQGSFDVIFSPASLGGQAAVFIADGHFAPFFNPPELVGIVPLDSAIGNFSFLANTVIPGGFLDAAIYQLTENLVFNFDSGVTATLSTGSEFEGLLTADGSVEFDLISGVNNGEWEFFLPDNPDTPEFDPKTIFADSSVFEFGQTAGSTAGGYLAEGTDVKTPEPGTILGLLAVSGLGLGLKRKKKS